MDAFNDNERPADRPCDRCGNAFDSGSFVVSGGKIVEVACSSCYGPMHELADRQPDPG